jgi:hypothetical protein
MSATQELFESCKPDIWDADITFAAINYRVAQSWNALPVTDENGNISALAIKLSLANDTTETFIIERFPALVLKKLIEKLETAGWNTARVTSSKVPGSGKNAKP